MYNGSHPYPSSSVLLFRLFKWSIKNYHCVRFFWFFLSMSYVTKLFLTGPTSTVLNRSLQRKLYFVTLPCNTSILRTYTSGGTLLHLRVVRSIVFLVLGSRNSSLLELNETPVHPLTTWVFPSTRSHVIVYSNRLSVSVSTPCDFGVFLGFRIRYKSPLRPSLKGVPSL